NGQYAPGSTIKPFLALAAMQAVGFDPTQTVMCPGWFRLPGSKRRFRDWKKWGHKTVDLHAAIVQSCDVFFYTLAVNLGIDYMHDFLSSFGFGAYTGIDMIGESKGLLPSPEWKRARGEVWYRGETVVTGIGQGPVLVTPLQLAAAVNTLANRGTRLKPRMLRSIEDPKMKVRQQTVAERLGEIKVTDAHDWDMLTASMIDVVHGEKGTARGIGWNAKYKIAGKTGTAQVINQDETYDEEKTPERLRDHALFIAFAPAEDPQIAVAVVVENGGHGSSAAAPIARKLMDAYLLPKEAKITASLAQDATND
ncbi:MAG: penicillin-binding transpeptidase domain-containing protein, partial [Acidiferrobacterales bacterium]